MANEWDPQHLAVVTLLRSIGQSDPAALAGMVKTTRARPDAMDLLAETLREDRKESQLLLNRVIEAVQKDPAFSELAIDLVTWKVVPYVSALFRQPSEGGRPKKGVLVRYRDGFEAFAVEEIRQVLVKWESLVPWEEKPEAVRGFLLREWDARRFPYTSDELAAKLHEPPESVAPQRLSFWKPLLPFIAVAVFKMKKRRAAALLEKGDERRTGIRPKRLAAWVWLSADEQPNRDADVTRFLDRIEKQTAPK